MVKKKSKNIKRSKKYINDLSGPFQLYISFFVIYHIDWLSMYVCGNSTHQSIIVLVHPYIKTPYILARSPDDPQRIRVASVFELSACLFDCLFSVGKFSNSSPHPPLLQQCLLCYLLARSPDDPQRIRVASVFELFFVCLSVLTNL